MNMEAPPESWNLCRMSFENLRVYQAARRLELGVNELTARYRGQFAEYDLNNEMIHGNYYEQRLGPGITKEMALWVKDGDPNAKLFVNDYDITTGRHEAPCGGRADD